VMYMRGFRDLDGHQWSFLYLDMSAMPGSSRAARGQPFSVRDVSPHKGPRMKAGSGRFPQIRALCGETRRCGHPTRRARLKFSGQATRSMADSAPSARICDRRSAGLRPIGPKQPTRPR
jgi:hypothetical protein